MTLAGFDWINDFEHALQSVTFTTTSMTAGKSLTVSLANDNGDQSTLSVPLQVVAQYPAPKLVMSTFGTNYLAGAGAVKLDAEAGLDVASFSAIQSITVEFIEDSYVAGDDELLFSSVEGSTIQGTFDTVAGKLVLTGAGKLTEWIAALHEIKYQSVSPEFEVGARYLKITVQDYGIENNTDSEFFSISKKLEIAEHVAPTITLASSSIALGANDEFATITEDLSLSSGDLLLFGATVSITKNFIPGEDVLVVSYLSEGMDAEFNESTGILTITGVATAFEYEDALRSILFVDSAGYRTPGQLEITLSVFDGLAPSAERILVLNVEAAPYISGEIDNVLIYTDGHELEMIGAGLKVEYDGELGGAIVSLAAGFHSDQDVLTFVDQNGISGSFDANAGVLTLSGNASAANYERALESIGYRNSRYNPVDGERTVSFQLLSGSSLSNLSFALISVEPDVVPPQVATGASASYTEDGAAVFVAPEFTLTARDATTPFLAAPEVLYGVEIDIVNYVDGEDVLNFTSTDKIVGDFNSIEGRIFLTGEATFDEYEAAIRSVTYLNTSDVPTTIARQISIRLLDSGENGLANQAVLTQVVIGVADSVSLSSGTAEDIRVLQNDEPVSLGLDDLVFSSGELSTGELELRFTATELPDDTLGRILLADGTSLELNSPYSISELAGLRFELEIGGRGVIPP